MARPSLQKSLQPKKIMKLVIKVFGIELIERSISLFPSRSRSQQLLHHLITFSIPVPWSAVKRHFAQTNAAPFTLHSHATPQAAFVKTSTPRVRLPSLTVPFASIQRCLQSLAISPCSQTFALTAQANVLQLSPDTLHLFHATRHSVHLAITPP